MFLAQKRFRVCWKNYVMEMLGGTGRREIWSSWFSRTLFTPFHVLAAIDRVNFVIFFLLLR